MGLARIQRVMTKLYTDASFRDRFFADPQAVGRALELSSDEEQQLAQLAAPQVNFFANSLRRKRLNEVCKLLPLTHRVLGEGFVKLFWRYAVTYVPKGIKKHQEDAFAFCAFVRHVVLGEGIEPPWVVDLVRYEVARLKATNPTCRWMVGWFRYPMGMLVRSLTQGDGVLLPPVQPTIAFWFRPLRRSRLCHIDLSLPSLEWLRVRQSASPSEFRSLLAN